MTESAWDYNLFYTIYKYNILSYIILSFIGINAFKKITFLSSSYCAVFSFLH